MNRPDAMARADLRARLTAIARAVLGGLISVLGVGVLVFFAVRAIPGDPAAALVGENATAVDRAELMACLRLDRPLPVQLALFLRDLLTLSLGTVCDGEPRSVWAELAPHLGPTLRLAALSVGLGAAVAVPAALAAELRRGGALDRLGHAVSLVGLSLPAFWLGPMALLLFCVWVPVFPAPSDPAAGPWAIVLPALCLALVLGARVFRFARAALREVLPSDYVRTARGKGVSEAGVLVRHALRNAAVPIVTVIALQLSGVVAGALVIEKVFGRPGLGTLLLDAVAVRNLPVVQGVVLVVAALQVVVNAGVEVLYRLIDPRIDQGSGGDP